MRSDPGQQLRPNPDGLKPILASDAQAASPQQLQPLIGHDPAARTHRTMATIRRQLHTPSVGSKPATISAIRPASTQLIRDHEQHPSASHPSASSLTHDIM
ncbi:hypothetical protein ACLOJK_004387 [Asimina triloba]